jgi:hypothetical protein
VLDGAAQPHRMGTVAGDGDLLHPPVIAGTGPVDHLLEDTRQQLPDPSLTLGSTAAPGTLTTDVLR